MKLIIDRDLLLAGLVPAEAITNRRSPSPFGSAVVLRTDGQTPIISSRDSGRPRKLACASALKKQRPGCRLTASNLRVR